METLTTTQTGIPFIDCGDCGGNHPATRRHCGGCGAPSLFLDAAGACLRCAGGDARDVTGCYCPSDCGCKPSNSRPNYCGCTGKHGA